MTSTTGIQEFQPTAPDHSPSTPIPRGIRSELSWSVRCVASCPFDGHDRFESSDFLRIDRTSVPDQGVRHG